MSKTKPNPNPDLADAAACERHRRALARRYKLVPSKVESEPVDGWLTDCRGGIGRRSIVTWIASPEALIAAGLTSHGLVDQVLRTREYASFTDHAGTCWMLGSNGGDRGDEYGMSVTAFYLPDFDVDPFGVRTVKLTRSVERMLRKATGRRVRLHDLRATSAAAES